MTSTLDSSNTLMDGSSLSISEQRKQELKLLFPGVFTETKNDQGEVIETLDFERLKAELGEFSDVYDNRRERYGMDWPGKRDCLRHIQQTSQATLKPCRKESVDFDSTENLFIEGDNLEVLKLLQKSYYGKVKMIYIDPPYNTGKEFIYPDNFSDSLGDYLEYAGLKEQGGDNKKWSSSNKANEGRFHTNWLNMMYPRLYLARNLLKEDGVIFISIDDNEVENLRRMCDEIFGEENHLGTFIWKRRQNADNRNQSNVSVDHEYVVLYSRSLGASLSGVSIDISKYKNPDKDQRGPWASIDLSGLANQSQRPNLHYDIMDPATGLKYPPNPNRGWSKSKDNVANMISEGRVLFPSKPTGRPREKKFLKDLQSHTTGYSTALKSELVGFTTNGTREVREVLDGNYFDFPKPIDFLSELIKQGTEEGDLIIDFFAGSGSLAHAVMSQSIDDKQSKNFILVQLPEILDEKSAAAGIGYKTIADISKERLRLAGAKIRAEQESQLDLENKQTLDLGFKVLKLDQSNFKQWQAPDKDISDEDFIQQMELNVDHVDPNASQEDLLYELLIKAGVMPTVSIEKITIVGHELYSVDEATLLIHLDGDINRDLIDAILEQAPSQFICLDKAFHGDDQLKANAAKTFQAFNHGKDEVDCIDFKTV
jgi:adenine-specific DNA-methyltransferase